MNWAARTLVSGVMLACSLPARCADFTDALGHTVRLQHPPLSVVSTSLMTDEFLVDLLPAGRILALSRTADDPVLSNVVEAAQGVKGRVDTSLETLLRLDADLVLAPDWSDSSDLDFLRKKGVAVYLVKTPRTWSEVKRRISELGELLSRREASTQLLARLAKVETLLSIRRARITAPQTIMEYNSMGSSMGLGTLWNEVTTMAGLTNLASKLGADQYGYAPVSLEMLLRLDPDWLIVPSDGALSSYGQAGLRGPWSGDPVYSSLKAVKSGHLYRLSEALKTSTSHYALGASVALAYAAYPNLP